MRKFILISFFPVVSILIIQSCSLQKQNENMKVVSFEKVVDKNVPSYEICNSFSLEKKDVVKYFTLAKEVDGHEFHSEAVIVPCTYRGTIDIDGEVKEWNLNLFVAGFGQTFGSGMNILPEARFNLEKMKISLIHDTGKFKFLRIFPKVYAAKHVEYVDHVKILLVGPTGLQHRASVRIGQTGRRVVELAHEPEQGLGAVVTRRVVNVFEGLFDEPWLDAEAFGRDLVGLVAEIAGIEG